MATWWTGPSQRRLFSSVEIRDRNYERWTSGVVLSESKARLLEYIRSLWYCPDSSYKMRHLPAEFGKYLPALHNLHSLTLSDIRVEHIGEEGFRTCFSAFRGSLTYLYLDAFVTSFSAFVALVDYFPNITTLELDSFVLRPDKGPVPPQSRPFRGKIHLHAQAHFLEFFDRFAKLDLEYEELVIDTPLFIFKETEFVESALRVGASTVKFLRLTAELECEYPSPAPFIETASLPTPLTFKPKIQ